MLSPYSHHQQGPADSRWLIVYVELEVGPSKIGPWYGAISLAVKTERLVKLEGADSLLSKDVKRWYIW